MFIKKLQHLINSEVRVVTFLFLISFFARIPIVIILGDTALDYEWKNLVYNLVHHGQLIWQTFDNGFLLPNLWMPPLYAYYLYLFSFLGLDNNNYILLVLYSQIFVASISIVLFYKLNKLFFSNKTSFYSSLVFSLFPLYLYACSQISSISLQVFLTIAFLYLFFLIKTKKTFFYTFIFSFISGLLILLRGEFWFIYLLSLIYLYLFLKIPLKKVSVIFLITLITTSPYLIRNFLIFDKIVVINSFGYNLWKGNHPYAKENSISSGSMLLNKNLMKKIDTIKINNLYRVHFDKIFLKEALKNIKSDPVGHSVFYIKKTFSFVFIDFKPTDPKYWHPLHYIPLLLFGIGSVLGMILSNKKSAELNYLIYILFINTGIFSTVSIMPRYKLVILPLQIIFTIIFFQFFKKITRKKVIN